MSKLSFGFRRLLVRWTDIQWLITDIKAKRKVRRECRLNNECNEEAERRIQYREFGGELCVAFDNIPIAPVTENNESILYDCREVFQKYIYKQRE